MRVFNPADSATTVEVSRPMKGDGAPVGPAEPLHGQLVDLRGRYLNSFEGSFALGPHGIATARLATI